MHSLPDFETLSHSEPNVQAKVLGVLLGDDHRPGFLPRLLDRAGLAGTAAWGSPEAQAVFFTRPLRAYLRAQIGCPEDVAGAQRAITEFLDLPPAFALRRNRDGRLTHPLGWNRNFVAGMLDGSPEAVGQLGRDRCAARLWLMEELANTEVDLILQVKATVIFCEVKWLSGLGPASQKPALRDYAVTQIVRQALAGQYLAGTLGCSVHHLTLTRRPASGLPAQVPPGRLRELVPSAEASYALHHATWQDVYEVAGDCLPAGHGLLAYMRRKQATRGRRMVPLI